MKERIESILAASDFSSDATHASERAALLAGEHGASLKLLHVVRADLLDELQERIGIARGVAQRLVDGARLDLEALATRLRTAAMSAPVCILRTGNVLDETLENADHADVLVLGAHGLRPTKDVLLGTTAERMLRKSRRPLIVVRTEPRAPYRRVLVAVDFSLHSLHALRFAQMLSPGALIHLFHAFECPYEGRLRQASVSEESIRQYRDQYRDQARANLDAMLNKSGLRIARTSTAIMNGDAKFATSTAAAEWGADLIVLGKHGRSAIGELLIGSVTRHTVSRANCDVAVVPDWPRL